MFQEQDGDTFFWMYYDSLEDAVQEAGDRDIYEASLKNIGQFDVRVTKRITKKVIKKEKRNG